MTLRKSGPTLLAAILVAGATVLLLGVVQRLYWRPGRQSGAMMPGALSAPQVRQKPAAENFLPKRAVPRQPPVKGFDVLTAEAAAGRVADEELVLAVEINGQARAWPLNVMTGPQREVFNDQLGGRAIAATW